MALITAIYFTCVAAETEKWGRIIKEADIKVE
jgi:hypothetical protein